MSKTNYTFWELISDVNIENGIEIPMIQRDYAQGRKSPKVNSIREEFLNDLLAKSEGLKSGVIKEPIELDFIYGSIDNNKFIPLDGQQRLTTLFLIHWYLCIRDKKLTDFCDVLSRFTYQTRTTSKDFCLKLTEKQRQEDFWDSLFGVQDEVGEEIIPSSLIENQPWFFLNWRNDPTIDSILNMLDDIHVSFKESSLKFVDLIDTKKRFITFHYLPINTYGRSDALYVKMNARGKVLTDFENFKAKFENFLRDNHELHILSFTEKIDGVWCDLFWSFIKSDEQIEAFDRFDLVDTPLLNFISYITEMLFYKEKLNEEKEFDTSFNTIKEVYASEQNVEFLFNSFEVFVRIGESEYKEKIREFFNSIFSLNYSPNKISLFDSSINLFNLCLFRRNKFDIKEKALLYCLIYYLKSSQDSVATENLRDYMRICRNYILSINQKSKDSIIPELRKEYYFNIIGAFEKIYDNQDVYAALIEKQKDISFKAETIEHELKKAEMFSLSANSKSLVHKLEDSSILQGVLVNIIPNTLEGFDFEKRVRDFEQIWALEDDSLIARALLSTGDFSEKIASSNFGEVRFFGKGKKWSRLLTSRSGVIYSILETFFNNLSHIQGNSIEERLNNLINLNLANREFEEWEKLFINHPSILSSKKNIFVFSWSGRNDYRVELLTGVTLGAHHINAYANAVIQEINDDSRIDSDKSYSTKSDPSCLQLKNGVKLTAQSDHWLVENMPEEKLQILQNELNLNVNESGLLELRTSDELDFVNVAKEFIEKIFQ